MKKKIILFGCQKICIDIINFILKRDDLDLSLVLTYHIPQDYAVSGINILDFCQKKKIRVIRSKQVTSGIENLVKKIKPDLIISAYYRNILSKKIWSSSKVQSINIHPSLLPHYRGPVPTAWSLLNQEKFSGVTIHKINDTIDGGDILVKKKFIIKKNETGYSLYNRTMEFGFLLLKKNFDRIINNRIKPVKQKKGGSYYGPINNFQFIDWRQSSETIDAIVRVRSYPFNVAQTKMYNRYFFINSVKVIKNKYLIQRPGKILKIYNDDTLVVSTSNGCILIKDYEVIPKFKNKREKNIYLKEGSFFQ